MRWGEARESPGSHLRHLRAGSAVPSPAGVAFCGVAALRLRGHGLGRAAPAEAFSSAPCFGRCRQRAATRRERRVSVPLECSQGAAAQPLWPLKSRFPPLVPAGGAEPARGAPRGWGRHGDKGAGRARARARPRPLAALLTSGGSSRAASGRFLPRGRAAAARALPAAPGPGPRTAGAAAMATAAPAGPPAGPRRAAPPAPAGRGGRRPAAAAAAPRTGRAPRRGGRAGAEGSGGRRRPGGARRGRAPRGRAGAAGARAAAGPAWRAGAAGGGARRCSAPGWPRCSAPAVSAGPARPGRGAAAPPRLPAGRRGGSRGCAGAAGPVPARGVSGGAGRGQPAGRCVSRHRLTESA